jgi:hypothetical protein
MSNEQEMWTIFDRPADYPDHFVARKFIGVQGQCVPTNEFRFAKSLAEIRETIPWGLMCFVRHPSDPPQVVETWL